MRNITQKSKVFLKYTFVLTFFSIMYSCQTEELTTTNSDSLTNKSTNTVSKSAVTTPVSTKTTTGDCSIDCIKVDGPFFETTEQQIVTWGNGSSKTVDIMYYNTTTDFVLKVKSTNGWSDLVIDGVSSWTNGPVAANTWGTLTIPLSANWKACDRKSFLLQIAGNGPQAAFNVDYSLFGICKDTDCTTSFTGEAVSCGTSREAIYKFKSDTDLTYFKIQGGLTNFTGADAIVTVTGGTNIIKTQSTPGGSSNRIIKVEGGLAKCSEVTINVKWNSTNSGGVITGSWSVSTNDSNVAPNPVLGLTCN